MDKIKAFISLYTCSIYKINNAAFIHLDREKCSAY